MSTIVLNACSRPLLCSFAAVGADATDWRGERNTRFASEIGSELCLVVPTLSVDLSTHESYWGLELDPVFDACARFQGGWRWILVVPPHAAKRLPAQIATPFGQPVEVFTAWSRAGAVEPPQWLVVELPFATKGYMERRDLAVWRELDFLETNVNLPALAHETCGAPAADLFSAVRTALAQGGEHTVALKVEDSGDYGKGSTLRQVAVEVWSPDFDRCEAQAELGYEFREGRWQCPSVSVRLDPGWRDEIANSELVEIEQFGCVEFLSPARGDLSWTREEIDQARRCRNSC